MFYQQKFSNSTIKKLVLLLCKFCLFTDIILFFFAHIVNVWTSHQHCCCAAEAISQLVISFILELHWRRLDWCTISVTSAPACPHWRLSGAIILKNPIWVRHINSSLPFSWFFCTLQMNELSSYMQMENWFINPYNRNVFKITV